MLKIYFLFSWFESGHTQVGTRTTPVKIFQISDKPIFFFMILIIQEYIFEVSIISNLEINTSTLYIYNPIKNCTLYIVQSREEYRVQSTEHRAQSTKYRVQSTEYRVQSTEYRVQSTEYRVQSTEYRVQSTEYRVQYIYH